MNASDHRLWTVSWVGLLVGLASLVVVLSLHRQVFFALNFCAAVVCLGLASVTGVVHVVRTRQARGLIPFLVGGLLLAALVTLAVLVLSSDFGDLVAAPT